MQIQALSLIDWFLIQNIFQDLTDDKNFATNGSIVTSGNHEGQNEEDKHIELNVTAVGKRSTKRPLDVKRKIYDEKRSKDDTAPDQAVIVLQDVNKNQMDEDDVYGQTIAFSMRHIRDPMKKAFAKIKIQEIIYQAQFGSFENHFKEITSQTSSTMS